MASAKRVELYPGMDGIPFRLQAGQDMPFVKEDDPFHRRPQEVRDGRAKVFDLGKKEDLKEYNTIIDRAAKGQVLLSREDVQWDTKRQTFVAFVRWLELYLEVPDTTRGQYDEQGHRTFS